MQNKVFISYKNTSDGAQTVDSLMAHQLYTALTESGIPCFFAGETLQKIGADKFKERIDLELDNCIIMVVVGTSLANINSRWVKYEWDGFYLDILNGCKNGKVFTYVDGINPHVLPRALRTVQSFDRTKDSIETLVMFIENAIRDIEQGQIVENNAADPANRNYDSSYQFSAQFLYSSIKAMKDDSAESILCKLQKLSKIFSAISTFKHYRGIEESEDFFQKIYSIITEGCTFNKINNLIKIKGPLGSYKNLFLQYIYLYIEKGSESIFPIYLNLEVYERIQQKHNSDDQLRLEQIIHNHLETIKKLIAKETRRTPLLIIDGIRNYSTGQDRIYTQIKESIKNLRCNIVAGIDTDFTYNTNRKFSVHPLVGTNYEYYVRITSMSTYSKKESIAFIDNCLDAFDINIPYQNVDTTTIYRRLMQLNVIKLDAYWLVNLLKEMLGNILSDNLSIADLYESICRKTMDSESIDYAAKLAYEYEYGTSDFTNIRFSFDKWHVIEKHRSVLDYLIARYYIIKLAELDVNNIENSKEQLRFFNMILPKAVTVFVSPMINRIDAYESKILNIAYNYYDQMSVFEKNQLIYWMGRLKNKTGIEESVELLKKFRTIQLQQYLAKSEAGTDAKKNAFLLRTISVSLIVLGDKPAAESYFDLLIKDQYTNEVNRAFHLTYYGDKPYIPNKTLLDFDDDVSRGVNTFEILCSSVQVKIDNHIFNSFVILEVFTLCSLLQARIESEGLGEVTLETKKYAVFTQRYLKWICKQRRLREFENMNNYFLWMQNELEYYYNENNIYSPSSVYNEYSTANSVLRTGWVKRNIPEPENIVEHMYNCWLIGALYLPAKLSDKDYDKNKILNILLIHDIAETKTGDIIRSEKQTRQRFYDENENTVMNSLLFSGTYPRSQNLANWFDAWDNWYGKKDINYQIAKDIDNIQAIFQFCEYYLQCKENFIEDDAFNWYDGIYDMKTETGREIADKLIVQNPKFKEINQRFGIQDDNY